MDDDVIIFGHRGIPTISTENSLDSFKKILDYDVKGVELDVHMTADGKLVVIHDFNTLKMTGVNHNIIDTKYSVIEDLVIGESEKIPLLSEVFDLLKDRVFYDIEVKSNGSTKNRKAIVKKLYEMIERYHLTNHCIISSFDPVLLKVFNGLKTGIPTAYIYCSDKEVPFILRYGLGTFITQAPIIKPHHKQLKGLIFFILTKILKKTCYTWTINSLEDFHYVISRGCRGVCSDNPHLLRIGNSN